MKALNYILHGISLAAIIFLLTKTMGNNMGKPTKKNANVGSTVSDSAQKSGMAFFVMDTIENNYTYIKEARERLKVTESRMNNELEAAKKNYVSRLQQLQQRAPTMSQAEGESAQAEINKMQQEISAKETRMMQQLQDQQFKQMQDIHKRIKDFVTAYNEDKDYNLIISRQSGDFIYYADSTRDITKEIIKGLNEAYEQSKKKE